MDMFLYLFYSFAYLSLLIWSTSVSPQNKLWSFLSIIYLVLIGLILDNTVIAAGRIIGEGDFLETLNLLRFWSHALITPTLVLYSFGVLRAAEIKGMNKKRALNIAMLFTLILIFIEIRTEVIGLELGPLWEYGVLRYVPIEALNGAPFMILLVTLTLIAAGILLWIKNGWAWMFIGAFVMTLGSMIPIPINSSAITNGFELILLILLVATKRHLEQTNNFQI
ncbi:hypothetical protein CWR48_06550 [Oceanobacillus arenosus]|uniref:Phospholipid phosphatase n=2 Tax=Oceanobacillus arenosus TaxID=1229153 RepID=A0A3D8PYU5_9BACI|nr:hypothetical protein CWR48_06550 [Oceanobacillus arenosus]